MLTYFQYITYNINPWGENMKKKITLLLVILLTLCLTGCGYQKENGKSEYY